MNQHCIQRMPLQAPHGGDLVAHSRGQSWVLPKDSFVGATCATTIVPNAREGEAP